MKSIYHNQLSQHKLGEYRNNIQNTHKNKIAFVNFPVYKIHLAKINTGLNNKEETHCPK